MGSLFPFTLEHTQTHTTKRRAGYAKEMMSSSKESALGCSGSITLSINKGLILVKLTVSKTPQRRQGSTHSSF